MRANARRSRRSTWATAAPSSHGRPAFFTTKVCAYYGGSVKVDGEWVQHEQSVMVLPDMADLQALMEDHRFFTPAYLGPSDWIGLDLTAGSDFDEVAELLEDSYRRTAGVRRVARLDLSRRS